MFAPLFFLLAAPQIASAAPFDFPTPAPSTAPISVIHPTEGVILPTMGHEFIIGSVSDPNGRLTINNQAVPIYKDGAFVSWLPVSTGSFTFHCRLLTSATTFAYDRHVIVTPPPQPLPLSPLAIVSSSLSPGENEVLRPGDWLVARMQATPRQKAAFWVPTVGWLPMSDPSGEGFYAGAYQVRPGDRASPFTVRFRIGGFWSGASARSMGTVTFAEAPPRIAVATDSEDVIVKTGPDEGNVFPVLKGMPFVIVGRKGIWDKIWLSPSEDGWLEDAHLQDLPKGTPPPSAQLSAISTRPSAEGTSVLFSLDTRVPFQVDEADDLRSLTLKFYYTHAHNNWIIYRPDDEMVSSISFRQAASDVAEARINFKRSAILWGYHVDYEGPYVRIDLRQAPPIAAPPRSPLSGLRVFLDPGHMPSAPGAIGPLGTREMDVNFAIAEEAAALLKKQGAVPLMSRPNDQDETQLVTRPEEALAENADIFVSIHNNNTSDGENPYDYPHGYSVFYYHPQSLALARDIYAAYGKTLPIPGEDVRFGNLLVIRMTSQIPAVLSESAYMTLPDQEALLRTRSFRKEIAEGIVLGLKNFASSVRRKELADARGTARKIKPETDKPASRPRKDASRARGRVRARYRARRRRR